MLDMQERMEKKLDEEASCSISKRMICFYSLYFQ